MVVPVERVGSTKIKQFIGNELHLNFSNNKRTLTVIGNNCKVKLSQNSGCLKIVGDHCKVKVLSGEGTIEYVGNGGKIVLGENVPHNVINYIGNGGEIYPINKEDSKFEKTAKIPTETRRTRESSCNINICNSNKLHIPISMVSNFVIPDIHIRLKKPTN